MSKNLLSDIGKKLIKEDVERKAEEYLVRTLGFDVCSMDALRCYQYHHKNILLKI